jgi:hypothetical protein
MDVKKNKKNWNSTFFDEFFGAKKTFYKIAATPSIFLKNLKIFFALSIPNKCISGKIYSFAPSCKNGARNSWMITFFCYPFIISNFAVQAHLSRISNLSEKSFVVLGASIFIILLFILWSILILFVFHFYPLFKSKMHILNEIYFSSSLLY